MISTYALESADNASPDVEVWDPAIQKFKSRVPEKLETIAQKTGLSIEQVARVAAHKHRTAHGDHFQDNHETADHFIENMGLLRSITFTHRNPIPISDLRKWTTIGFLVGWKTAAEKLSNEAATIALVCTLAMSLIFPSFIVWPEFDNLYDPSLSDHMDVETLRVMYGAFTWFSIVFSILSVVFSVIVIAQVNLCCTDEDLAKFIWNFEWIAGISFASFCATMICFAGSAWTVLALKCSAPVFIIGSTVMLVVFSFLWITFALAHILHRLPLIEKYNARLNMAFFEI